MGFHHLNMKPIVSRRLVDIDATGRGFKTQNSKPRSRNKFGMTTRPEPNHLVMLNLFQHLVCFFLPSADASFIPVHRMGFSDALLNKNVLDFKWGSQ